MKKIKWTYYYPNGTYKNGNIEVPVPTGYIDWAWDNSSGQKVAVPHIRTEKWTEDFYPGWNIHDLEIIWMEVDE